MSMGGMMVKRWRKTWMYLLMLLPASVYRGREPRLDDANRAVPDCR